MAEWKSEKNNAGVEESFLQGHGDESGDEEVVVKGGSRRGIGPMLWVVLSVTATLAGRRILRSGFPYPFYFVFLIQLAAYLIVAVTVLVVRLMDFRGAKRKPEEEYKFLDVFVLGCRTLASSIFSGAAMLSGAKALMLYSNLPVLAMLPILTYVCDSIFSRIFYALRLLPQDQNTSLWRFPKVLLVIVGVVLAVYQDYHLDREALLFALAASSLSSLSKVFSKIGPKVELGTQTWESPLYFYLLAGIIPLVMTGLATSKLENMVMAGHIARSWTINYRLIHLLPAVALHGLFSSSLNSAFPFISEEHVGGALEEPSDVAREAAAATLQSGFWIFVVGVLGQETNFVDWFQVIAFTIIYILSVEPKVIGYYPPKIFNIITRIFCRRPLPIHAEPWQLPFFLIATTIIFSILISTNVIHWVDTVAYQRNLKSWHGPKTASLDTTYRPPQLRSFEIVIAHSAGDPVDSITSLISTVALSPQISILEPRIKIYTKDPIFNSTTSKPSSLTGHFTGPVTFQPLPNIGGTTATFLHHILNSWSSLPVQTIFLSTTTNTPTTLPLLQDRLTTYFLPLAYPIPDALPKTGFLNLGPQEVCSCTQCFDSLSWEDIFHLMPSMFGAVFPASPKCDSVLLTYGNNFVASAARIRGVKREIWQLFYDALVNEDLGNAWAHDKSKLPVRLQGEGEVGRWGKGGVYERGDSLESPFLGLTVERLWGVLLQCNEARLAWNCPSLWRGSRMGGGKEDCGCIE